MRLFSVPFPKDYKDYGDYWRANYETIDEPKYSYTRDELMADVRRIYNEVRLMSYYTSLIAELTF